jgi:predicted PurR-regulated permease PerM
MTAPGTQRLADTATQRLLILIPVILLFALLLWDVRLALQPLVVFPLLIFALWPARQSVSGRHAIALAAIVFAIWFVLHLQAVLLPFVLAFAIAYLLAPLVNEVTAHRVPRALAALMVLLPFLGIIVLLLVLLVPQIQQQVFELVGRLPELGNRIANWILQLRQRLLMDGRGWLSDEQIARLQNLQASDLTTLVSERWDSISRNLWQALLGIGKGVGAGLGILLAILGYLIVAPVVAFYLLLSWPTMLAKTEEMLPPAWRPGVVGFVREYDVALGRFVRGQLIEATLVAVMTSLALWLLGFPAAVLMGVIAGLGNLIPNLGLFLSIIPGLFIALTAPDIGSALLKLLGVFAAVQFIDSSITGPRIVGGSVGLNPVWVMMAVLVFGNLFGVMGMFLAVPIAVLIKMALARAWARYKSSAMYRTETAEAES